MSASPPSDAFRIAHATIDIVEQHKARITLVFCQVFMSETPLSPLSISDLVYVARDLLDRLTEMVTPLRHPMSPELTALLRDDAHKDSILKTFEGACRLALPPQGQAMIINAWKEMLRALIYAPQ